MFAVCVYSETQGCGEDHEIEWLIDEVFIYEIVYYRAPRDELESVPFCEEKRGGVMRYV